MEFITLREVFDAIKARVSVPKDSGEFADEITSSEAAGLLHQTLSNGSENRPRWVEENKISGKPIFNDTAVHLEAMAMLEHASGYHARSAKNRSNHVSSYLRAGLDPNAVPIGINPADSPFPGVQFFRPREIGFDRAELVEFLEGKIGHNLTPSPAPVPPAAPVGAVGRPLQRTAAQDNAIICEIKKQGYDPLALPKNPTGKPGVKAIIRTALSGNKLFGSLSSTIFNKAWERLAARDDIVIQK